MTTLDAMELLYGDQAPPANYSAEQLYADKIAEDLIATLNDWHSRPEKWDNALDQQIHAWYANPPKMFPKKPYFSPSAATACKRELYEKGIGSKRDVGGQPPYQKRWTSLGTAIGDLIQRDLLFIGKHMKETPFKFVFNPDGTPMFEDFAKANFPVKVGDEAFYLYGTPDGIMEYTDRETGAITRVGLEIKSKQTSAARTSLHSMREPDEKHVAQCKLYSLMYDCDYYVILYVNASKKSWFISDEDFAKTPDIRAFGMHITDEDRGAVLAPLADVMKAIRERKAPRVDLTKWVFNSFKEAIARSITDEEMADLAGQVRLAEKSRLKAHEIRQYTESFESLKKLRESGPN